MAEGFSISSALDLTIYDIAYILLSNRLKAPLITADDRLYERAKTISRVIHVKEY